MKNWSQNKSRDYERTKLRTRNISGFYKIVEKVKIYKY